MGLPLTRVHTDAVIGVLEAAGITVGDAIAKVSPDPDAPLLEPPYAVVYPLPGRLTGTLSAPDDHGELVYQVSYVGSGREQCEGLRDIGRAALLAGVDVAGRHIERVSVEMEGHVHRDDDARPPLFLCPERYRLLSTPGGDGS